MKKLDSNLVELLAKNERWNEVDNIMEEYRELTERLEVDRLEVQELFYRIINYLKSDDPNLRDLGATYVMNTSRELYWKIPVRIRKRIRSALKGKKKRTGVYD
ncbi:MAG TPA: hypothetical protein ENF25_00930, partial [Thermoprotei archaeon]|nr:hypothetical protein [Thermoprotei archaeon]